jgi:serine/threonine-protein kinase
MNDDLLASLPVEPGGVVAGKYRVEKLLAAGGMGAVIKARHEVLNKDVAIKLMRPETTGSVEAGQRFLREARATATLESDYIARVTDVDLLDDGTPFMVMEYLEGRDLSSVLDVHDRIEVRQAVDWTMQVLSGLAHAHAMGIVHRDLKPSNLFLVKRTDGTRRIKILDFGISKVMDETRADSGGVKAGATTSTQALLGTPRYMSPEQVQSSKNVDGRTDLWALGLILYELVTGTYPFEGESTGAVLANILTSPLSTAHAVRAEVPEAISKVIERCLARQRDDRYSSAREVMEALAPFASKRMQALLLDAEDAPLTIPPPASVVAGGEVVATADTVMSDASESASEALDAADQDAIDTRRAQIEQTDMSWQDAGEKYGGKRKLLVGAAVTLAATAAAFAFLQGPGSSSTAAEAPSVSPAASGEASAHTALRGPTAQSTSAPSASLPSSASTVASSATPSATVAPSVSAVATTAPTAVGAGTVPRAQPGARGGPAGAVKGKPTGGGAKAKGDDPLGLKRRR